jgi:hypothetical protein
MSFRIANSFMMAGESAYARFLGYPLDLASAAMARH